MHEQTKHDLTDVGRITKISYDTFNPDIDQCEPDYSVKETYDIKNESDLLSLITLCVLNLNEIHDIPSDDIIDKLSFLENYGFKGFHKK